jgi:signal recognition particle receptor subunit beta
MNVQAAAISLQGVNFAVVMVDIDFIKTSGEPDMAIESLSPTFGGVPVVLMAQNQQGSPTYYGDQQIVQLLRDVEVDKMPWKEYSAG